MDQQSERPLDLGTFDPRDHLDRVRNSRMLDLLTKAIPPAKVSLIKPESPMQVAKRLIAQYRSGTFTIPKPPPLAHPPEPARHVGWENPFSNAGRIGDFPALTLRELQGERELYAAPATARRIAAAYDLEIQATSAVPEGVVYVFDHEALRRAIKDEPVPSLPLPSDLLSDWEFDLSLRVPQDAFKIIKITGVS